MTFVKKHINLSYSFDGDRERKERWQYPLEALRELVMNAVVHRDYKSPSDIVIKVFDDRISISNPGKLYGQLRIEDLERDDYVSSLRNRLIAEMFYLTGDVERYGTGYVRIREALLDYPEMSIAVEEMGNFFKVELCRATPQVTPQVTEQVTEQVMRLMQILDTPKTRRELQELMQLGHREHFRSEYLQPALKARLIAMTKPDKPNAADQRYILTEKGQAALHKRQC